MPQKQEKWIIIYKYYW